jgi:hypothetical protein
VALAAPVYADRMPIPEATICNKTKGKAYLATATEDSYTGWTTRGWRYIKPDECHRFRADAFFVRGNPPVEGAAKRTQPACIFLKKVFSYTPKNLGKDYRAQCKKAGGRMVQFKRVPYGKKPPKLIIKR